MDRYLRPEDRLRCLGGGLLLFYRFGKGYEKRLSYNSYGKPLMDGKGKFNLSHSGDLVVLAVSDEMAAVSDEAVGVDVQRQEPGDLLEMAKISFHPAEQRFLASGKNQRERFYSIWTLKESYMKAVGMGFSLPSSSFSVSFSHGEPKVDGDDEYHLKEIPFFSGYSLSVCSKRPAGKMETEEVSMDYGKLHPMLERR